MSGPDTKRQVFAKRGLAETVYDVGIPRCVTYSDALGMWVSGRRRDPETGRAAAGD